MPRRLTKRLTRALTRPLRRFARDDAGSYSLETLLVFPLLVWAVLACFSYFDGLRQSNVNIKAAHTLSDLISRETSLIDDDYIDGLYKVLDFLVYTDAETQLRVSVVTYNGDEEKFDLDWSAARGEADALNSATLADVADRLPDTASGDTVILVETWSPYHAPFVMGLADRVDHNFVVTRPRFAMKLKWDDGKNGSTS